MFTDINPKTTREFMIRFLDLQRRAKTPINVFLNTPGGECSHGFAMADVMMRAKNTIRTIAMGEICSMGPFIFLAGTKGYRYITKNAFIMFHPLSVGSSDYLEFVKARLRNADQIEKIYDDFILSRCKIPRKVFEKCKSTELWLTAKQAIEYGIADKYWEDVK